MKTLGKIATLVVLAAATARATPSRVVAMGDAGRYIEDDTNVLLYPGELARWSHFAYADLGGPSGLQPTLTETQGGGVNAGAYLRLSDGFHFGLATSSFAPGEMSAFLGQLAGSPSTNAGAYGGIAGLAPLRLYDVLGAWGDKNLSVGGRLSIGSVAQEYIPSESIKIDGTEKPRKADFQAQRQVRFTAGVSGSSGDTTFDGAFDYTYYGMSYTKNEVNPIKSGGIGHGILLSGRARVALSRYWDIVPQATYRLTTFSLNETQTMPGYGAASNAEVDNLPDAEDNLHGRLTHNLDIGAGLHLRASKTSFFVLAVGIQYGRISTTFDQRKTPEGGERQTLVTDSVTSLSSLPYVKFAWEATALDWLKLRAGVEKYAFGRYTLNHRKEINPNAGPDGLSTDDTTETSKSLATADLVDFAPYIGAAATLQGFTVDLLVNNGFLTNGPFFLSGGAAPLAARATLSWKF